MNENSFDTKSGTQDKIEGTANVLTGKIKEATGKVIGNPRMEARGDVDQIQGRVQEKVGEIKKIFGQ